MVQYLFPTCIVRLVINNPLTNCNEAIYFEITKVKDGTFWGVAQETYRLMDWVGLMDGEQMTWRKEHINEIPIEWQPKRFQKAVKHLNGKDRRVIMTGIR